MRYDRHSSRRGVADALVPPTRGLDEQPRVTGVRLLGVAPDGGCRVSPASPQWTGDSSLWPCSSPSSPFTTTYCGRALPGILLCGARTFLCPLAWTATVWLASDLRFYSFATRQATVSPARSGTSASSPIGYSAGTC